MPETKRWVLVLCQWEGFLQICKWFLVHSCNDLIIIINIWIVIFKTRKIYHLTGQYLQNSLLVFNWVIWRISYETGISDRPDLAEPQHPSPLCKSPLTWTHSDMTATPQVTALLTEGCAFTRSQPHMKVSFLLPVETLQPRGKGFPTCSWMTGSLTELRFTSGNKM